MSFATDIKELRLAQELTQQELADAVHVSRQTVSAWENGKNYPSLDVLKALSQQFDLSFERILFGEEQMTQEKSNIATTIDHDLALKKKYKKATLTLATFFALIVAGILTLIIGYYQGIGGIDRFNPFLQYTVAYTKLPSDEIVTPGPSNHQGRWTAWFSDDEIGTEWVKLTLETGQNPDNLSVALAPGSSLKNKIYWHQPIQELVTESNDQGASAAQENMTK